MCAFQGNKTHQHDDTTLNIGEKIFREINAISRKFREMDFTKNFVKLISKNPKTLVFSGNPGYPQNPGFFRYPIHHNFENVIWPLSYSSSSFLVCWALVASHWLLMTFFFRENDYQTWDPEKIVIETVLASIILDLLLAGSEIFHKIRLHYFKNSNTTAQQNPYNVTEPNNATNYEMTTRPQQMPMAWISCIILKIPKYFALYFYARLQRKRASNRRKKNYDSTILQIRKCPQYSISNISRKLWLIYVCINF